MVVFFVSIPYFDILFTLNFTFLISYIKHTPNFMDINWENSKDVNLDEISHPLSIVHFILKWKKLNMLVKN